MQVVSSHTRLSADIVGLHRFQHGVLSYDGGKDEPSNVH